LLHFAPEPGLAERFAQMPHLRYITADRYDRSASLQLDITNIALGTGSVDLILCSHVLEHVPNDRQAMRELYRVLKPTGTALVLVPIQGEQTFEDPAITDPIQREQYFGQFDHVRLYGRDFSLRLREAGFQVTTVEAKDVLVDQAEIERMGLPINETIFVCRKEL